MKKIIIFISLCIVTVLLCTAISADTSSSHFPDVPQDAWYYDYVISAYNSGIMVGKDDGNFHPSDTITRAEFVAVLCRISATEYEGYAENLSFPDISKDAWYSDYAGWAEKNNLIKGYPDGTFRPDSLLTRQEMAEILSRFSSFKLIRSPKKATIDTFADNETIPEWAANSVEKLRDFGIISGDENGRFNPTTNATRAEMAKIATELDRMVFLNDRQRRNHFDEIFGYSEDDAPLPYRIYIPEDYDESKEYPLLIFLHGNSAQGNDNEKHYGIVKYAFLSPYSPVYDSIVVVPQCPEGLWWDDQYGTIDLLADLMDYINERYSTDSTRQYVSGISMGGQGSWEMAIHRPEKVSAIMPIAGVGYGLYSGLEGAESLIDLNPDMLDVNIRMIYDDDDGYSPGWYNRQLYAALVDAGATNITYHETVGLRHGICGAYAGYYDISNLEWLYAQRRETVGPESSK